MSPHEGPDAIAGAVGGIVVHYQDRHIVIYDGELIFQSLDKKLNVSPFIERGDNNHYFHKG